MKCQLDFCIYNRDFVCILNEITVDAAGLCGDCILAPVPARELQALKEKALAQYFHEKPCNGKEKVV